MKSFRRIPALTVTGFGLWAITTLVGHAQSSLPVFPGAEGFGTRTRAAYAGSPEPTIYRVTNLNDSGPGSLRAALEAAGPRIVIFEISGNISLANPIRITNPYLTVAAQTAPSPGITVKNDYIYISKSHDILIQHLRVRPGDVGGSSYGTGRQGISVEGGSYNVVIDHCSVSWATDDHLQAFPWDGLPRDITFSNCIVSEGLYRTPEYWESGKGLLIGEHSKRISFLRNLVAHHLERMPMIKRDVEAIVANNVLYNWESDSGATYIASDGTPADTFVSYVGNRIIKGPNTKSYGAIALSFYGDHNGGGIGRGSKLYMADNSLDGGGMIEFVNYASFDPRVSSPPVSLAGITILPGNAVESHVLANAGARPADRDSHDQRIVSEVASRTGRLKFLGGYGDWPALAVNVRSLTLPSNPHGVTASGYTNLERWLHDHAAVVEGRTPESVPTTGPPPPTGVRIIQN